jgi:hypothetical protein
LWQLKPTSKLANNHSMQSNPSLLYKAWKQLIRAYLISLVVSLAIGLLVVKAGFIAPERLFEASTKRVSHVLPVFEVGARVGVDLGVLLFGWNVFGAFATISFLYTAALFNPDHMGMQPRGLRRIFCGSKRMKLLCYLPGCSKIDVEALRRVYVWLMVPLLGIILLGIESGLQVSTAAYMRGSFLSAVMALLPHGLIEIPTFAFAGAVTFAAHLRIREAAQGNVTPSVFKQLGDHRKAMPIKKIVWIVVGGLLLSGLVEAHITPRLMQIYN